MNDLLVTDAAEEPVTAAQLRADLRDPGDSDETLLELLREARHYFEAQTSLTTASQTRRLTLDTWPLRSGQGLEDWDGVREGSILAEAARWVELQRGPLLTIESVTLFDSANVGAEWASSNYYADTGHIPGRLVLSDGVSFPAPGRSGSGIVIEYTAGYATSAEVPPQYLRAIRQIAAHWYENRELLDFDGGSKVPMQAQRIIDNSRVRRL